MSTLKAKRAIVCGSTQGIGRACAIELARLGASVALMARHPEGLERVQGELDKSHGQLHDSIQVDFSDWQSVRQKATGYVAAHGPVHILVNNTGGPPAGPVF